MAGAGGTGKGALQRGEWAGGFPSLGPMPGCALGFLHTQASFPPRDSKGTLQLPLSASGDLLALGEMVCVLRCEDILLGSSLMKKREVLRVDSQLKKPNLPRGCF